MKQIVDLAYRITDNLSGLSRANWMLRLFGSFVAPLIGEVRPKVLALDDYECVVEVPLNRKNRNRMFNGMYVGVFGIGADVVGGALVQYWIRKQPRRISMIVKDLQIDLRRRAEADVRFVTKDSSKIGELVEAAAHSTERQHATIDVDAVSTVNEEDAVVARIRISMSVKAAA